MADVFISYERGSETRARQVAGQLMTAGFEIWLDADLPTHRAYTDVIREQLQAAKAVLVLWTDEATKSEWVRAEADLAREQRKLVQASLDGSLPPLPFNQIHSGDLSHWRGDVRDPHWLKVVESIVALVGDDAPGSPAVVGGPQRAISSQLHARRLGWSAAAAAAVLAAAAAFWFLLKPSHPQATAPTAVAVMPFQVESASPDTRYFADGVTDTIQSALTSNQVTVISKADAAALAGPSAADAIARLGVRLILEGSAAADGKRLDVSVHVDDAMGHTTLWSGHFTGTADQPDELKTSVAAATVSVLKCSSDAVGPHGLTDRQVLMVYLQACDLYERQDDPQTRDELVDALRQVTLRAPRFAPGLAMRADALSGLAGGSSPDQAAVLRAEARADSEQALAIDPNNARAYMAVLNLAPATDWVGNEAIARRALQADPDSEWSNGILATVLAEVGRMQEAADAMRKANAANPLALDWSTESARMSALAGRTQEASDEAADVAKAWPNEGGARAGRLQVAAILGDWNEALALLDESGQSPLTDPVRSCFLALKTPTPRRAGEGARSGESSGDPAGRVRSGVPLPGANGICRRRLRRGAVLPPRRPEWSAAGRVVRSRGRRHAPRSALHAAREPHRPRPLLARHRQVAGLLRRAGPALRLQG